MNQAQTIDWVSLPNTVTQIGQKAFKGCSNLKLFPGGDEIAIVGIGDDAFNGCSSMNFYEEDLIDGQYFTSFSIKTIGARAFQGCTSLTWPFQDNVLVSLGEDAFKGSALNAFFSLSLSEMGSNVFYGCNSLKKAVLPKMTSIPDRTFYLCKKLETVKTGELSSIGSYAFYLCEKMTDVGSDISDNIIRLPNITSLSDGSFYRCRSVTNLDLPNLTAAGSSAFNELGYVSGSNSNLTVLSVPKLANIATSDYVFGFIKIDELSLPSITSIPKLTFGYTGIKTIRFGSSLRTFGDTGSRGSAFNDVVFLPERNLYFEGTTPPEFREFAFFTDFNINTVLLPLTSIHVPSGCKEAYVTALTNANSQYAAYTSIIIDDL